MFNEYTEIIRNITVLFLVNVYFLYTFREPCRGFAYSLTKEIQ